MCAGILGVELERLVQRDKIYQLQQAQTQTRRARRITTVVSGLLILAIAAGGMAFYQYRQAQANFIRAEQLLSTVRRSINFLNFDARDTFEYYLPVKEREQISSEIDHLAELLANHGGTTPNDLYQRAVTYLQKADLILRNSQMDPAEALPLYQQAHGLLESLVKRHPDNSQFQRDLAVSYWNLARVYENMNNTQQTQHYYQQALDKLLVMQQQGILAKDDEQSIGVLEQKLTALVSDSQ